MSAPDNKDKNAIAIGPAQGVCDKHDPTYYPKFKKWADDYFVIKHRGETRGLGGIFFDDLKDRSEDALLGTIAGCRSRSRSISRMMGEDDLLAAGCVVADLPTCMLSELCYFKRPAAVRCHLRRRRGGSRMILVMLNLIVICLLCVLW